jgi:TfoX/Sxy family transcriptional regulator of competence genes
MMPTRAGRGGRSDPGGPDDSIEEQLMQMPKPTDADLARFRSMVPDDPRVEVRPMFGNLGAFVHGNMFMGLFGAQIGVKLAQADAATLLATDGAGPFGPAERPMSGWVTLPAAMIGSPDGARWVATSLDHIAAMPPKATKAAKG